MKKISAAVLDIAGPFIDALPENPSDQARRDAVAIAVTVWNALALMRRGDERAWRALTDYFRQLPEKDSATMALLVAEAVRRKKARHTNDIRVVQNWNLTIRDGGAATFRAEASAPEEWVRANGGSRAKRQHG